MGIMELGAIGELVGGVAVVASLLYVGLQVRQSNRQASQRYEIEKNESSRQFARDTIPTFLALTDPALIGTFRRGLGDFDALTEDEKLQVDMWLSTLGSRCSLAGELGVERDAYAYRVVLFFVSLIKTPGGSRFWGATRYRYATPFAQEVERLVGDPAIPAVTEQNPWFLEVAPGEDA